MYINPKCKCCNKKSEYKVQEHYSRKSSNWTQVFEDTGDCWSYIKEQLGIQETGYYCENHIIL